MRTARRDPVYIEEPTVSRWLFGSSSAAWIWLIARLWLGWEWLQAGWGKVFGGNLTWRVWDWGDPGVGFTGDQNVGWVRSGTVQLPDGTTQSRDVGDAVAGFASNAIETGTEGPNPDIAYGWYVDFLEWLRDTGHVVVGPVVAVGELTIGILLILGAFTGVAALLGAVLNFTFVFAGAAGVNPAMILVSGLLVLAWRNAGWYGLDRWLLPALGTPWHRGDLVEAWAGGVGGEEREREPAPAVEDGWTPD